MTAGAQLEPVCLVREPISMFTITMRFFTIRHDGVRVKGAVGPRMLGRDGLIETKGRSDLTLSST